MRLFYSNQFNHVVEKVAGDPAAVHIQKRAQIKAANKPMTFRRRIQLKNADGT